MSTPCPNEHDPSCAPGAEQHHRGRNNNAQSFPPAMGQFREKLYALVIRASKSSLSLQWRHPARVAPRISAPAVARALSPSSSRNAPLATQVAPAPTPTTSVAENYTGGKQALLSRSYPIPVPLAPSPPSCSAAVRKDPAMPCSAIAMARRARVTAHTPRSTRAQKTYFASRRVRRLRSLSFSRRASNTAAADASSALVWTTVALCPWKSPRSSKDVSADLYVCPRTNHVFSLKITEP